MKKLDATQVAHYAGGRLFCGTGKNAATFVVTDSRKAGAGSLFIGLVGEKNDGNDYAESAYATGCRMLLLSSQAMAEHIKIEHADADVILVDDTLAGMQRLAKAYLTSCKIIKIGVTGSTGKTSTKEMLRCIFASKYRTISNFENFNNHIGVPLTAFEVEADTEVGIFEMGMNHLGEIRLLADIVRPETAVITNVGISHIGNLGSRENILKAKLEITTFMDKSSTLVYNRDNDMLAALATTDTPYALVETGESADAAHGVRISEVRDGGGSGVDFTLEAGGHSADFHVPLPGAHNASNAALAVGAALRYGITLEECADALRDLSVTGNRLNIKESHGIKVINDTYNASPDSVKAAIDVLAALECGRRVAILADMFELGEGTAVFHEEVGEYAAQKGIDLVITIGENARHIAKGAERTLPSERILSFACSDEFFASSQGIIKKGDGVLVKGSHGMHMDKVAAYLLETGEWA